MPSKNVEPFNIALMHLVRLEVRLRSPGSDPNDLEDLTQETLLVLLREWPRILTAYDPERGAWHPWLRMVVRHAVKNQFRKLARVRSREVAPISIEWVAARRGESDRHELSALIRDSLESLRSSLPPRTWEIFERRFLLRQRVTRISLEMKLRPCRVSKLVAKSKNALRRILVVRFSEFEQPRLQEMLRGRKKAGGGEKSRCKLYSGRIIQRGFTRVGKLLCVAWVILPGARVFGMRQCSFAGDLSLRDLGH